MQFFVGTNGISVLPSGIVGRFKRSRCSCQVVGTSSKLPGLFATKWVGKFAKPLPETLPNGRSPVIEGTVSEYLAVPREVLQPFYYITGEEPQEWAGIEIINQEGIEIMRYAGDKIKQVFAYLEEKVVVGVQTDDLDKAAHQFMMESRVFPSTLNCDGFPKSIMTNVNEVVHSGIPDSAMLEDGDIINIYVAVFVEGYHVCASRMFYVGQPHEEAVRLCEQARRATSEAIQLCKHAQQYNAIGNQIQKIADENQYHVVKEIVGHGIGERFHGEPVILQTENKRKGIMLENQAFTVGPVFTENQCELELWDNDWTAMTSDRCLSAQWMDTIIITSHGFEQIT